MSVPILNKAYDPIPEGAIYVGRPSPWGNPYSHLSSGLAPYHVATRAQAISRFEWWLQRKLVTDPTFLEPLRWATALVCWCKPADCHARVIQEVMALHDN